MRFSLLFLGIIIISTSCVEQSQKDPQEIIDKAIEHYGGDLYKNVFIEFDFRERHYTMKREGSRFVYTRSLADSVGVIRDELINATKFQRYLDDTKVMISKEREQAYTSSVNSVLYFVQLPYPLNDGAVNKELLGEVELEGNQYYKIRITFDQVGGGEDYEDIFCYWINKETFTMDYIAYSYEESDGIGTRFRKTINPQRVGGILFQDYINYKPRKELGVPPVEDHDRLFIEGQLEELSKIENRNIRVEQLGPAV